MTDMPDRGGRWSRDPETGALTPLPDDAPAPADPPVPTDKPAEGDVKKKGKA